MAGWLKRFFGGSDSPKSENPITEPAPFRPAKLPPRRSDSTQEVSPSKNRQPQSPSATVMRELRIKMLTSSPSQLGLNPTDEFQKVCGVLMDWPIGDHIATVVTMRTGDASVYTTSTFGVIGGIGHEQVRIAAMKCVRTAQELYEDARRTDEYPYPTKRRILFYFVCYDGVRVIESDAEAVTDKNHKLHQLFSNAQEVLTELRLITDSKTE